MILSRLQLKASIMFWPVLAYSPFFFTLWVYDILRIGYFALIASFLFLSVKRYFKNDVYILFMILLYATILIIRNSSGMSGIFTIGNYCLTIIFGWGLYRHLISKKYRFEMFLDLYVKFFYLIVIFSFFSLVFFLTIGEFDIFQFKSETYTHKVTPFGVLIKKTFGPITVYRSFFYFVEPVHVSIFYAANISLIGPLLKENKKNFIRINYIGAILAMSMTFLVIMAVVFMLNRIRSSITMILMIIFAMFLLIFIQLIDMYSYSSGGDRVERFLIFFNTMKQANITQWLFGYGVLFETGESKAFNSGLTLSIFEAGILGTLLQTLIFITMVPNLLVFVLFVLSALVLDPLHMPMFWLMIILASYATKNNST